ncbi:MAG TPA: omptin family outer membrane protease [Burkholderiales bacterium]|nr:omptin family outer membrane protease [Burkholderiales bacterium]
MRIRVLILALAISPAAIAQEEWPISRRGDLGVRYWLTTGETKLSHNAQDLDPTLGNPTSVLVYENLDASVLELFGRQNFRNNLFLKGAVGVGRINTGSFDDEDFETGQVKFSDTTSSVPQGRIGYGMIDLGHQWVLREGAISLGVFGGFSQWTEDYDAYGATDHLGFIGGDISRDVNVISNKVRWRALRVGFAGQFNLGRARLALDLAAVPYAKFYNEDSHHLRDDLGPVPNIIDEGEGWGVQWDAELRYEILRRTELGAGLRYWYLEGRKGTTDFRNVPSAAETPIVDFYTRRTGLTISLRRTW